MQLDKEKIIEAIAIDGKHYGLFSTENEAEEFIDDRRKDAE